MQLRNLTYSVTVDGETEKVTAENEPDYDLPQKRKFETATITTHCRYCGAEHILSYSNSFPKTIDYDCSHCDKTTSITKGHFSRNHDTHNVLNQLHEEARRRESYAIGQNISSYKTTWKSVKNNSYIVEILQGITCILIPILVFCIFALFSFVVSIDAGNMIYAYSDSSLLGLASFGIIYVLCILPFMGVSLKLTDGIVKKIKQQYLPKDSTLEPEMLRQKYIRNGIDDPHQTLVPKTNLAEGEKTSDFQTRTSAAELNLETQS